MIWIFILALILIGLFLLVMEILVIPGTGVVGIIGIAMVVFGIYLTYTNYGNLAGNFTLGGTFAFSIIILIIAIRSKTWNMFSLKSTIEGKVNVHNENFIKIGEIGKSISRLAPMGKANFNGKYFEVSSTGDFIDEGKEIVIVKIDHNKIYVKTKKIIKL